MSEKNDNGAMMTKCVAAMHGVVGHREDILGFVIAVLDADANCLVISRATTQDMAGRLDSAHSAIADTIGDAFFVANLTEDNANG